MQFNNRSCKITGNVLQYQGVRNMNKFPYTDDGSRYHTLKFHNRQTFGGEVYKAVINAGFSCPNIDGTKGFGGCIYCLGGGGMNYTGLSVREQIQIQSEQILKKHPDSGIIAYFQSFSNTYDSPERLRAVYSEALECDICGMSVATRADCIDEKIVEILKEIPVPLTVELGLQTAHDSTARLINRGHSFGEFLKGYELLKNAGIRVCVHIINGLPAENAEMALETAKILGRLKPDGVKLHSLHVLKGTRLFEMYRSGEYTPLSMEDYINITVGQLEYFPPETVIERLTGDGDKALLAAPLWSADKRAVLGGIMKRQKQLDSVQGLKFGV